MTSARPPETASRVEKRWKTRIGSSELSTVTEVPSRIRCGLAGDRGQHHVGRADREVGAVVLPDAEEVQADLVGEHRLRDHLPDRLRVADRGAVGAVLQVAEGVQPEGGRLRRPQHVVVHEGPSLASPPQRCPRDRHSVESPHEDRHRRRQHPSRPQGRRRRRAGCTRSRRARTDAEFVLVDLADYDLVLLDDETVPSDANRDVRLAGDPPLERDDRRARRLRLGHPGVQPRRPGRDEERPRRALAGVGQQDRRASWPTASTAAPARSSSGG